MIIKIKKVYYCDFCGKHGLRSIAKHEKHCTKNPNRDCRLECDTVDLPGLIEKYRKLLVFEKIGDINLQTLIEKPNIKDIKNDTGNCPNCTLAIIRCAGLDNCYNREEFDYKKELESWWAEVNECERRADEQSAMYG